MEATTFQGGGIQRGLLPSALLGFLLLTLGGCQLPNFEGPQLQDPPLGFHKEPDAGQQRQMFPGWERVYHDAWVNAAWGEVSTIHINGYPQVVMRTDVQNALEDAKASVTDPLIFSGVQEMTIDGRKAWGWAERLENDEIGLAWIGYRVAVPYDTITYTIEFSTGDPVFKANPDTLLAMAATFAIGKVTWNVPLIVGIGVVLLVVVSLLRKRSRERQIRLQSITLKKVEREEEEKEEEKEGQEDKGGG